jgi:hypothetical protein
LNVVRSLRAAAPADDECATASRTTVAPSASARESLTISRTAASAKASLAAWSETGPERSGGRIEFTAADCLEPLGHHAPIDARHVAVDRQRLHRRFRRETRRQKQPRCRINGIGGLHRRRGGRLRLHVQRFEPRRA